MARFLDCSGWLVALAVVCVGHGDAWAQRKQPDSALPVTQLFALSPPGGRQGSQCEIAITSGNYLNGAEKLRFSHPGITATRLGGPADQLRFQVTIAADVPVGLHDCRLEGDFGVSNPRAFAVDSRPQLSESGDNHSLSSSQDMPLETIVSGATDPRGIDYYSFSAREGRRVIVDLWAQRIDSRLDATLVAYHADGREIKSNRNTNRRDPLVDLAIPEDGRYVVAVHDLRYYGGPEYFYRLHLHTGPYVDYVLPNAGVAGSNEEYWVYGRNLPQGEATDVVTADRQRLQRQSVRIALPSDPQTAAALPSYLASSESMLEAFEFRLPHSLGAANPATLLYAQSPLASEQEPNSTADQAQEVTVPCEFVGQFQTRSDEDWLEFAAKKGQTLVFEFTSQRLGLPTDPQAQLFRKQRDNNGKVTWNKQYDVDDEVKDAGGNAFTTAHGDGSFRLTVTDDVVYGLMISDFHGSMGDPRRLYRLSIREPKPDFRLTAVTTYPTIGKDARPWSVCLRQAESATIDVVALRRDGFAGAIEVSCEGLPEGVGCEPLTIGPAQDAAPLVLTNTSKLDWSGPVRITGRAKINDHDVTRVARNGSAVWPSFMDENNGVWPAESRVVRETFVSLRAAETCPLAIAPQANQAISVARGGQVQIPMNVERQAGFAEAVTLNAANLPATFKVPPVQIAATATSGAVAFTIPADAPLGLTTFCIKAQAKYKYTPSQAVSAIGQPTATGDPKKDQPPELLLVAPSKTIQLNITPKDG